MLCVVSGRRQRHHDADHHRAGDRLLRLGGTMPQRGFTLVELVIVIIIIGILGAVGAARFSDRASFDSASYTEQMRAVMRYGQKLAVAQNRNVFVSLNGNRVALCYTADADCDAADQVPAASGSNSGSASTVTQCTPSGRWACEGNPSGVSYVVSANGTLFGFDAMGRPISAAGALLTANVTMTVSVAGDSTTRPLTVEVETGYVH